MTHLSEDVLNDWADGSLDGEELEAAEQHLTTCVSCLAAARAIRELVNDIGGLPREIEPPAELRTRISASIDAADVDIIAAPSRSVHTTPAKPRWADRTIYAARAPLAVAALLLIALTATTTALLISRAPPSDSTVASAVGSPEFVAAELRYRRATAELEAMLEAIRAQLPAEAAQLLDRNLEVLDAALAEAREALGEDPENTTLTEMLLASYEKKLDLLRSAAASASI